MAPKQLKYIGQFYLIIKELKAFVSRINECNDNKSRIRVLKTQVLQYETRLTEIFSELSTHESDESFVIYMKYKDILFTWVVDLKQKSQVEEVNNSICVKSSVINLPKLEIPHFYGNCENCISFNELFKSPILDNKSISDLEKLEYRQASVRGDAAKLIRDFAITVDNLKNCWDILCSRYENKRQLALSQINKLFSITISLENTSKLLLEIIDIYHSFKQFWEHESVPKDISSKDEDELCESIFVNSHIHNDDGRYILNLPFRDDSSLKDVSAGGFELRKWSCIHPVVLSDLPNILKTNISSHSFHDESTQKNLGLFWDLNDDSFKHYVPGKLNPADWATIGLYLKQLLENSEWVAGPKWLHDFHSSSNSFIPFSEQPVPLVPIDQSESLSDSVVLSTGVDYSLSFLDKFSSYMKAVRTVAWIFRFFHNSKSVSKVTGPLYTHELETAIKKVVKLLQNGEYHT
ncbi:jerky-like protein [Trichonephila clavipes]|nr:jerky-like protein [Trichonephila clavipes]